MPRTCSVEGIREKLCGLESDEFEHDNHSNIRREGGRKAYCRLKTSKVCLVVALMPLHWNKLHVKIAGYRTMKAEDDEGMPP